MKDMKTRVFLMIVTIAMMTFSCGDDNINKPHGSMTPPEQVVVTKIVNKPGASVIYYQQPKDRNLKYIRAQWTTDSGKNMDATASFYTDSILINGFKDACDINVKLVSVSYGEVPSEPLIQPVSPLRPPYLLAFDQLVISPFYMWLTAAFNGNITEEKLSFFVYRENADFLDGWQEIAQNHSSLQNIEFNVEGQDTIRRKYAIRVRDTFGNWSDYKVATIKPWYEQLLDRRFFRECKIHRWDDIKGEWVFDAECVDYQGHDMHSWSGSYVSLPALWDNRIMQHIGYCYHTKPSGTRMPQSFCIDLGDAFVLSRLRVWFRSQSTRMGASSDDWQHVWKSGMPKTATVYASRYIDDQPIGNLKDDIYDEEAWIPIGFGSFTRADGTFNVPSGVGTEEDREKLEKGMDILFHYERFPVRYVRFQTHELYNTITTAVMIDEFRFFGDKP